MNRLNRTGRILLAALLGAVVASASMSADVVVLRARALVDSGLAIAANAVEPLRTSVRPAAGVASLHESEAIKDAVDTDGDGVADRSSPIEGGSGAAEPQCGGPYQRACCLGERDSGDPIHGGSLICEGDLLAVANCETTGDGVCECSNSILGISTMLACYPKNCGHEGERVCNFGEGAPACEQGLSPSWGCSGDCTGWDGSTSELTCIKHANVNVVIDEPDTGRTADLTAARPADVCPLTGYADLHLHMFAETAHGGGVLAGKAYDPEHGVNGALQQDYGTDKDMVNHDGSARVDQIGCPDGLTSCGTDIFHGDHGLDDPVGVGTKQDQLGNLGKPYFNAWPKWKTTTHQQVYWKWLKRAWQGGLRLTTMLAVTNSVMCKGNSREKDVNCDDSMWEIDRQLDAAIAFEEWNRDHDPDGEWFKIVKTPVDARNAIAAGKLAVVLGIEVEHLFNCEFPADKVRRVLGQIIADNGELDVDDVVEDLKKLYETDHVSDECNPATIREKLLDYYNNRHVRHIFPIHNFDNAFGGSAAWMSGIELGNRVAEGHWWLAEECPIQYGVKASPFENTIAWLSRFFFKMPLKEELEGVELLRLFWESTCNRFGLFPLGEDLLTAMMDLGMIIDVDHMSRKSFFKTLDMTDARQYPVVASHVLSYDMHIDSARHERMRTDGQLDRIRKHGGMIAAMLKDDVQDTDNRSNKVTKDYDFFGVIDDDCQQSSKSFAQAYQYAVDVMGNAVAFGSDFNGIAAHIGPRFGHDRCGGWLDAGPRQWQRDAQYEKNVRPRIMKNPLVYPFTIDHFGIFGQQKTGKRTFDFNVDGLAHVGLLPDLVAELKTIGLPVEYRDALMQSAEEYIRVWERGWARSKHEPLDYSGVASCPAIGSIQASAVPAIQGAPNRFPPNTVVEFKQVGTTARFPQAYVWDVGEQAVPEGDLKNEIVRARYPHPGTYHVTLHAGGRLAFTTAETDIAIGYFRPPDGLLTGPAQLSTGETGHFVLRGITTDNDPMTTDIRCGGAPPSSQGQRVADVLILDPNGVPQYPSFTLAFDCLWPPNTREMIVSATLRDIDGDTVKSLTVTRPPGTRPVATLHGPAALLPGEKGSYVINAVHTDNDPVTLSVSCGAGTMPFPWHAASLPERTFTTFTCQFPADQPWIIVTATARDIDGLTSTEMTVYNNTPPTAVLSGPDQSIVDATAVFRFSAHSFADLPLTLQPVSCGAHGKLVGGPAVTKFGPGLDTEYVVQCLFRAKNPANVVSVSFTDELGHLAIATKTVNVKGSPPMATIEGPDGLAVGETGRFAILARSTDLDPISLVDVLCDGNSATGGSKRSLNSLDFDITFDCTFPADRETIQVQATLADVDGAATASKLVVRYNTAAGSTDPVQASDTTTVSFAAITSSGNTTATPIEPTEAGELPGAFLLAKFAYEVTTTAIIEPPIVVCFTVPEAVDANIFQALRVLHNEEGVLVDRTILPPEQPAPDLPTRTICARTQSLSPFVVAVRDVTPPTLTVSDVTVTGRDPAVNGAAVTFAPSASDDHHLVSVVCTPASGTTFPFGRTAVSCTAADAADNRTEASFTVTVLDGVPPEIRALSLPNNGLIWPPNGRMVPLTVAATVTDNVSTPSCSITGVQSNEPSTAGDWRITGPLSVELKASRAGGGSGRVYTVTVKCVDAAGNAATSQVAAMVPHDQRK